MTNTHITLKRIKRHPPLAIIITSLLLSPSSPAEASPPTIALHFFGTVTAMPSNAEARTNRKMLQNCYQKGKAATKNARTRTQGSNKLKQKTSTYSSTSYPCSSTKTTIVCAGCRRDATSSHRRRQACKCSQHCAP